jgi:hypothetical protein
MPADAAAVLAHEDGPFAAPHSYTLAPGESFQPSSICVLWDGSAAAGDFLPCCSFYSQDGKLLGRSFPGTVPAGDLQRVTYSPFALSPGGADLSNVVLFNLSGQAATFLEAHLSSGIDLEDTSGIGLYIAEHGNGGLTIVNDGAPGSLLIQNQVGDVVLEADGGGTVTIRNPPLAPSLGGAPPVPAGVVVVQTGGGPFANKFIPYYNAAF